MKINRILINFFILFSFQISYAEPTFEIIPKGTQLFHWAKRSNINIENVRKEKKMNHETFMHAMSMDQHTFGGGVYVSLDPLDSSSYGDVLCVFELQTDITVARVTEYDEGRRTSAKTLGVSGLIVDEFSTNYIVLVDESTVQVEKIPTHDEFINILAKHSVTSRALKELALPRKGYNDVIIQPTMPELLQNVSFLQLIKERERIEKTILNGKKQSDTLIKNILNTGSNELKYFALNSLKERFDKSALEILNTALLNKNYKIQRHARQLLDTKLFEHQNKSCRKLF